MKQILKNIFILTHILLIINLFCLNNLFGQRTDSLKNLLKKLPKSDTSRINVLNELAFILRNTELATSKSHAEEALLLSRLIGYEKGEEEALGFLGLIFYRMGEYDAALQKHLESLKISEKRDNKKAIGFRYNDIANIYNEQGHFQKALEYHFKSLLLKETINDFEGIATSYNNISYCYFNLKEYNKSLEYALKAQELSKEKNFTRALAISYGRLGEIHFSNKKYDKALNCYFKAYELRKSVKDYHGLTGSMHSIAKTYQQMGDLGKALAYYHQALDTSAVHGIKLQMQKSYLGLAEVQVLMNNHVKAYEFYQRYAAIKDSIFNEKAHEQIAKMQALFEAEKNKAQIEILTKDAQLQEDKIKIQNVIINSVLAISLFFVIFSVVLYRINRQRRKANKLLKEQSAEIKEKNEELNQRNEELKSTLEIIEYQKKEIEQKNEEITASINYAQRIQNAMLPNIEELRNHFPESFVIFKPRDIVSGDFYWFQSIENEQGVVSKYVLAVADCTGHGIPGAFMSMIGNDLLNQIVVERGFIRADLILNELQKGIRRSLKQAESESRDGMDIALCVIDKEKNQLEYSGAMNPLFIFQELPNGGESFKEVKADKQPIGGFWDKEPAYSLHVFDLLNATTIYLFSDGYQDQFGGEKGKKFMVKRFRDLIQSIHLKPMSRQKTILEETITNWMAQSNEKQLDDITIVGLKIWR
ncbi:MAG: hypothetical protein OHK0038_07330 [Flammeovirgaceae bacterium]